MEKTTEKKFKLLDKVSGNILLARKAKEGLKLTALGMLKSKLLENFKELNPIDEELVVKSYMKQLKEAQSAYADDPQYAHKREELKKEIEVISEYMPKEMPREEIVCIVEGVLVALPENRKKMGPVMGKAMKAIRGVEGGKMVDGTTVKEIVEKLLGTLNRLRG